MQIHNRCIGFHSQNVFREWSARLVAIAKNCNQSCGEENTISIRTGRTWFLLPVTPTNMNRDRFNPLMFETACLGQEKIVESQIMLYDFCEKSGSRIIRERNQLFPSSTFNYPVLEQVWEPNSSLPCDSSNNCKSFHSHLETHFFGAIHQWRVDRPGTECPPNIGKENLVCTMIHEKKFLQELSFLHGLAPLLPFR